LSPARSRGTMLRDANLVPLPLKAAMRPGIEARLVCAVPLRVHRKVLGDFYGSLPLRKFAVLRAAVDAGCPAGPAPAPRQSLTARPGPLRERRPKRLCPA